jgi:putative peptidoglycan lipid II flippase
LISRGVRIIGASAGMGAALWVGLLWLARPLSRADIEGGLALAGICMIGIAAYALLGAALGVVRVSELRYVMRRQPGLTSADPGEQP